MCPRMVECLMWRQSWLGLIYLVLQCHSDVLRHGGRFNASVQRSLVSWPWRAAETAHPLSH